MEEEKFDWQIFEELNKDLKDSIVWLKFVIPW
jgi:hypothetical protein